MTVSVEARLAALEHLVVATLVAARVRVPELPVATARVAEHFRSFAAEHDPPGTVEHLDALLDALRDSLSFPINDQ